MLLAGTGFGGTHSNKCHSGNRSFINSWLSCSVYRTSSSFCLVLFPLPTAPHTLWNMCSSDLTAGNKEVHTHLHNYTCGFILLPPLCTSEIQIWLLKNRSTFLVASNVKLKVLFWFVLETSSCFSSRISDILWQQTLKQLSELEPSKLYTFAWCGGMR